MKASLSCDKSMHVVIATAWCTEHWQPAQQQSDDPSCHATHAVQAARRGFWKAIAPSHCGIPDCLSSIAMRPCGATQYGTTQAWPKTIYQATIGGHPDRAMSCNLQQSSSDALALPLRVAALIQDAQVQTKPWKIAGSFLNLLYHFGNHAGLFIGKIKGCFNGDQHHESKDSSHQAALTGEQSTHGIQQIHHNGNPVSFEDKGQTTQFDITPKQVLNCGILAIVKIGFSSSFLTGVRYATLFLRVAFFVPYHQLVELVQGASARRSYLLKRSTNLHQLCLFSFSSESGRDLTGVSS